MKFSVNGQDIKCIEKPSVVTYTNEMVAEFVFSDEWDGRTKTALFRTESAKPIAVVLTDDKCKIPQQVLRNTHRFYLGVIAGDIYTTVEAIVQVADTCYSDDSYIPDPSYDVYAEIIRKIEQLQAGTVSDDQLADAINTYVQDNPDKFAAGGTVSFDSLTDAQKAELKGEKGEKGDTGENGTDGSGVTANVITITGGHRVTLTDKNGNKSFDVLDGTGGAGGASTADKVSYVNSVYGNFENVGDCLDNILSKVYYVAPAISSFSSSPAGGNYEIGNSIASISFTWILNKDVTSQSLTGCTVTADSRSATYSTAVSSNKTFTLTVNDGTKTASKSISFSYMPKIYYGASTIPSAYNDAFLTSTLGSSKLANNKAGTYSVTAGSGQYIYFALPSSMGTPLFKIGGFDTELDLASTLNHKNASGYTQSYKVYKTTQPNLGSVTLVVS